MIYDFLIIGAGIAGASIGARLAGYGTVLILEMENQPGYHSTGRSAAVFAPNYGPQPIRALTRASAGFFTHPPDGFTKAPLLSPRGLLMLAREDQLEALDRFLEETAGETNKQRLNAEELLSAYPLLRKGYAAAGVLDHLDQDIGVDALHQGFLSDIRAKDGQLKTNAPVNALSRVCDIWEVSIKEETLQARVIINAAGAWADEIGALAGAEKIGLVPKRRTALMVDAPEGMAIENLPLIVDIDDDFYLKPDAGRLLISPANEDPTTPHDVQPEDLDIAYCVHYIEMAFNLKINRIGSKWAGLRSFVADKNPVVGFSHQVDGFFWLAGQGGYGIQTSPALADFSSSLILGEDVPDYILDEGLNPADISIDRLIVKA